MRSIQALATVGISTVLGAGFAHAHDLRYPTGLMDSLTPAPAIRAADGRYILAYRAHNWLDEHMQKWKSGAKGHSQQQNNARRAPAYDADEVKQAGDRANSLYAEAQKKQKAGKNDEALGLYGQSVAVRERIWGARDPAILEIVKTMSDIYRKQGKLSESETCLRKMLSVTAVRFGPGSKEQIPVLESLIVVCNKQSKSKDAGSYEKQLLAVKEKALGADDPGLAPLRTRVIAFLISQQRYAEAEPLLQKGIELREKANDTGADYLGLLDSYSGVLRESGRVHEAEKIESKAKELRASAVSSPAASPAPTEAPAGSAPVSQ